MSQKKNLQWHPAFFAGMQIELAEESDNLIFENEHLLGTKPNQIDILIIKKNSNLAIRKNIGRIFRKYNIIEYKSPSDYLSIDDFYHVYAYACLYKSNTEHANEISISELTLTLASYTYPRKLMDHFKKIRKFTIENPESGIYYIKGDIFPIQILWTKKLSEDTNFWLRNLSTDIDDKQWALKIMDLYQPHNKNILYDSVLDIIIQANHSIFEEVSPMCKALEEIYGKRYMKIIQEKDASLAEKDASLAEKDASLAEMRLYIKELEAKLALVGTS